MTDWEQVGKYVGTALLALVFAIALYKRSKKK